MSALLSLYAKALKERKYLLANEIERKFIEESNKIEDFYLRDVWMENLTLLSI